MLIFYAVTPSDMFLDAVPIPLNLFKYQALQL